MGLSSRVNEAGARQIEEVLRSQGVELLKLQLTGYRLHLDGLFVMIAPDLALANITLLPFWFLERLKEQKINLIEVHHQDDGAIINSLAVLLRDGVRTMTAEAGWNPAQAAALAWLEENRPSLSADHLTIWSFHEPSWREYRSSRWYMDRLEREGFEVERGTAGMPTAFR